MSRVRLDSGPLEVEIDPSYGCRLTSLRFDGRELLVTAGDSWIDWGAYPMAPWAGRVRNGRFTFDGREYRLPPNLGDHAIHGTVSAVPWERLGASTFTCLLEEPWPFPGRVVQSIEVTDHAVALRLEVHADHGRMPAACGWHPWFRKEVDGAGAELDFDAGYMLERDESGIATSHRVPPAPPPWDDCFGDLAGPAVITWPGAVELRIESSCDYMVVYDERDHALCVEPQTAPPDALNHGPPVVAPDAPLVATTRWQLRTLRG